MKKGSGGGAGGAGGPGRGGSTRKGAGGPQRPQTADDVPARKQRVGRAKGAGGERIAPPDEEGQEKIKLLEAQVARLQAAVAERDKTIAAQAAQLRARGGGAKAGGGACAGETSTTGALVAAEVYLSNWCESGLMPYVELLRMAFVCRTMRRKVLESLQLLRRLEFRKDLLWPLREAQRLEVVLRAVGQAGKGLEVLDLSALGRLPDSQTCRLVLGLQSLKDGKLKELILPGITPFKDVTKLLSTLTSLQRLDLSKNTLGDEGAIELSKCLGDLVGLRHLDLGGKNNIGLPGCRELAKKFASIPTLEELLLPNNRMGETGCDSLIKSLQDMTALRVLDLTSNQITHLGKNGNQRLGEALGSLTSLHTLRLSNTGLLGERLNALLLRGFMAKVPANGGQLLRLSLQRNGFHTEGCTALAKVLPSLPQLQELDVSDNDISPEGIRVLAPALVHMPLRELKVAENDLGPEGALLLGNVLGSLPELTFLDLTDNVIKSGVVDMVSADLPPSLTNLSLACNQLGDTGLEAISTSLHKLPNLKHLQLEENEISDAGITKLAAHLTDAKALVCINLIRNRIGDAGCSQLMKPVSKMPSFQQLQLGENKIGEVGGKRP